MGNHGLRARHDAAQHGDLALVHGQPAPIGDHVPIDIDDWARLGRYQRGQQDLGGTHTFKLSQKLTQRRAVIAPAKERCERMLMGIERAEAVDATQRRKKQRLKAAQKRRLAVMQQGKVIARMRLLMRLYRLRELGHNRAKGIVLVEPMGKQMHADKRQMGHNLDEMPLRLSFFFASPLGAVALCLD